jgi:heme exporter protein C
LFTFLTLVTGAIWGKPMWGTWWIWDARLTSELILLFLYLGYIGLYKALLTSKTPKIAPAILSVVGLVDLPVIHYSVYWWNTLHQGATITKFAKPSIDSTMLYPLLAMLLGMIALTIWIVGNRLQAEILQNSEKQSWLKQEVHV